MHIAPLAEEASHVEPEPLVQEPDEETEVQPPEDQLYQEPQPGYDYIPEATDELTADPSYQGRHPMHLNLCK